MRRLLLFLLALTMMTSMFAVPAKKNPFTYLQNDGTSLSLVLVGDESSHFYSTTDGVPVVKSDDSYYYALFEDGCLVASDVLAHNSDGRGEDEKTFIKANQGNVRSAADSIWSVRFNKRNNTRLAKKRANIASQTKGRKTFGLNTSYKGKKKGIVILVNFSNLSMKTSHTQKVFDNMFNLEGYSENNHVGSVHDFFYDQSYGQFDLSFDVVGPVKVSKAYSYYGANDRMGDDKYVCALTIEACRLADELGVDFSNYDWDGDGEVDQVYIIYAGMGEASGGTDSTIWPHEYELSSGVENGDGTGPLTLDNVVIDTYAMSCELGSDGMSMNGIGTACHEFSHCLGLPDFYDISYDGGFGMGSWDLLDSGSYNGPDQNGEVPCGYSAYERWFAGWLDFKELDSPCTVTDMPSLEDTAVAYVIYNDGCSDEFFTLENRQDQKWFSYVNEYTDIHGMLAIHVDHDTVIWVNNQVNTEASHQRMTIIPADGKYGRLVQTSSGTYYSVSESNYAGDPFPGTGKVKELTNTSHLSAGGKLYNKNTDGTYYMNKPVTDITETDGLISFDFMGGAAAGVSDVKSAYTSVVYYTLDGVRLAGEPTTPGVYIMKDGVEMKKILVR